MNPPQIPHEVISASAGSGKTFQLAHRYIKLLAMDTPPDRICALTFSRKAAGEIFESVVERLCVAATSDEAAEETARIAEIPSLSAVDAIAMLRAILSSLNRLHVGTLDSFMVSVVRTFPVELGVPADFRVMNSESAEAAELRKQILSAVFDARRTDETTRREWFEAFKQATFGREEKAFGEQLDGFVESLRERYYRVLPEGQRWGAREAIWGADAPWRPPLGETGLYHLVDSVREAVAEQGWPDSIVERWMAFADAVRVFRPGAPLPKPLVYLMEKLLPELQPLGRGCAQIKLNRTMCVLEGVLCEHVREMVQHVIGCELQGAAETTCGLFRILDLFENLYDRRARRLGLLSFNDTQYLLTANNTSGSGLVITREVDAEDRLYIDYRLDCQLDHWLLDEFQDTSDLQWAVLHNLIDEILQDDSGRRSLFYVGDVKQSIYRWRGGNPRLFGAILDHYGRRIEQRHLSVSYRSSPPVIESVNRVFDVLPVDLLPGDAVSRWRDIWREHESASMVCDQPGYACLIEPDHEGGARKPLDGDRYRLVAGLLREMRPIERGLSVAVLVRTNASGTAVVDVLRRECPGMTVVHEGNASILDCPVVTLLLAVLRFAAHPADTSAWRHIQMSPLYPVLSREIGDGDAICLAVLRGVQEEGFHHTLRRYGDILECAGAMDAFGRLRLGDLLSAAAEYDATCARDIDVFLRMIESFEVRELAGDHAVRVMTVHQSKGLGFDVVVLPDLMGKSVDKAHNLDFLVARTREDQQPSWILKSPRRMVGDSDAVLREHYIREDADACFDALCVLYVALTRAKRGLYMVSSFAGKSARALTDAALLKKQLAPDVDPLEGVGCEVGGEQAIRFFESGDARWYEQHAERAAPEPQEPVSLADDYVAKRSLRKRLQALEPSAEEDVMFPASRLFKAESRDVTAFGVAIHQLLERIEWVDDIDVDAIIEAWQRGAVMTPEVIRDVTAQFRHVVTIDDVRSLLTRPEGAVRLWREKGFELVTPDGLWMTGVFDRVLIHEGGAGSAESAVIIDYKSSMVESESQLERKVEVYRPQLVSYRQALSRILGLPEERIACKILFTRVGAVRTL
ncbi:MAG: UvrD-helicase domain-containing protein [Kiritimatiellae bacterium]|nr:UvrD-helicase domain-containing protein [Kiritimatiellia bacterium]